MGSVLHCGWRRICCRNGVGTESRDALGSEVSLTMRVAAAVIPPGHEAVAVSAYRLAYTNSRVASSVAGVIGLGHPATRVEVGTIAFANCRFAWSRPITARLAIVDRKVAAVGQEVGVNPVAGSYVAH